MKGPGSLYVLSFAFLQVRDIGWVELLEGDIDLALLECQAEGRRVGEVADDELWRLGACHNRLGFASRTTSSSRLKEVHLRVQGRRVRRPRARWDRGRSCRQGRPWAYGEVDGISGDEGREEAEPAR